MRFFPLVEQVFFDDGKNLKVHPGNGAICRLEGGIASLRIVQ